MDGTSCGRNGSSIAEAVAAALRAVQREAPLHAELRRIEADAVAGRETAADRRRYPSSWLALALRRSTSARGRVPVEIAAAACHWQALDADVQQLRLHVEVDAAFGSDDAPIAR